MLQLRNIQCLMEFIWRSWNYKTCSFCSVSRTQYIDFEVLSNFEYIFHYSLWKKINILALLIEILNSFQTFLVNKFMMNFKCQLRQLKMVAIVSVWIIRWFRKLIYISILKDRSKFVVEEKKHTERNISSKMQILESMHKSLPILGMSSSQSIQKHPFNARNVASFLIYGINSICNVGFLIFGANNLMEFIDSLYLTVTAVLAVLILINLSWQMRQLFEFLKHIEDTVERSKCYFGCSRFKHKKSLHFSGLEHPVSKTIYTKTHENIQKVVKISMFAFPGMTPFVVTIPPFIVSFSTYFTTDLGPEVLELPLPMW